MPRLSLAALLLAALPTLAAEPLSVCDLKKMSRCELDRIFAGGKAEALPVGAVRGTILCRVAGKLPRVRVKVGGAVWKGKYFYPDGCFTNQWVGFRAISSSAVIGPSLYDGKPCIILEYKPGTPVFGNTRDEIREIGPGLYLGRFYDRCPCQELQGYFVLEACCCK